MYAEFNKPQKIGFVQKWLSAEVHCEKRKGNRDQAREYCRKVESRVDGPWELGTWIVGQGERSDLTIAAALVRSGAPMIKVIDECPETFVRYHRGLERMSALVMESSQSKWRTLDVEVIYGRTGVGKTRSVMDRFSLEQLYKLDSMDPLWWDGYNGQDVLLIDEFYGQIRLSNMLKILDGYPYRLAIKGGFTFAKWTKVFITSNECPRAWYKSDINIDALSRRINRITFLD